MSLSRLSRTRRGFTLLELIVVIVILGILAALAIPTFASVIGRSETQAQLTSLEAVGRNAQALLSFERAEWDSPAGEAALTTAISELPVSAAGVFAAATVAVDGDVFPGPGEISYWVVPTGARAGFAQLASLDGDSLCRVFVPVNGKVAGGCSTVDLDDPDAPEAPSEVEDDADLGVIGGEQPEPPAPTYVAPAAVSPALNLTLSGTTVSFTWQAVAPTGQAPVSGYRVYVQPSGGTTWDASSRVSEGTALSLSETRTPGTWCYRVSAYGPGGESAMTAPLCTTVVDVPHAPTITSLVRTVTAGQAQVSYTSAPTGTLAATGWVATCVSSDGGTTRTGQTASEAPRMLNVDNLTAGKLYTCTVAGRNANGTGASSAPVGYAVPLGQVAWNASSGNGVNNPAWNGLINSAGLTGDALTTSAPPVAGYMTANAINGAGDGNGWRAWSTGPAWLSVDFGANRRVEATHVKVSYSPGNSGATGRAEGSVDGVTWTQIGTNHTMLTGSNHPNQSFTNAAPSNQYRYIRVVVSASAASYINIVEIEVYGTLLPAA